jgi:uncharacterized protein YjcR
MPKYPDTITDDMLDRYAHISSDEIMRDWNDTQDEISRIRRVYEAETIIAVDSLSEKERRIAEFKRTGRQGQIAEREEFCNFLSRLMDARAERGNRQLAEKRSAGTPGRVTPALTTER